MDPVSITAGVAALLKTTYAIGAELKAFHDALSTIDERLEGLLKDVEGLKLVLESMRDTFATITAEYGTGHLGAHWRNIARSIEDGQDMLALLQQKLQSVNKNAKHLDAIRKQIRMNLATDLIAHYQRQIQAYRDTLQLSVQAVILWNQVSYQRSVDAFVPRLSDLQEDIRCLALEMNRRIDSPQPAVQTQPESRALTNLRECIRTAASVLSSTSSIVSSRRGGNGRALSDFDDCFPAEQNVAMQRWMESRSMHGFERQSVHEQNPPQSVADVSTIDGTQDHSDSDMDDLETEMTHALLIAGKQKLLHGYDQEAERLLKLCLSKLTSTATRSPGTCLAIPNQATQCIEAVDHLLDIYTSRPDWSKAQAVLEQRMTIRAAVFSKYDVGYLDDLLRLAALLQRDGNPAGAHFQARRALKGYKRLGPSHRGVIGSLALLIELAQASGQEEDVEAFTFMLTEVELAVNCDLNVADPSEQRLEVPAQLSTVSAVDNLGPELSSTRSFDSSRMSNGDAKKTLLSSTSPSTLWDSNGTETPATSTTPDLRLDSKILRAANLRSQDITQSSASVKGGRAYAHRNESVLEKPTTADEEVSGLLISSEDMGSQIQCAVISTSGPDATKHDSMFQDPIMDDSSNVADGVIDNGKDERGAALEIPIEQKVDVPTGWATRNEVECDVVRPIACLEPSTSCFVGALENMESLPYQAAGGSDSAAPCAVQSGSDAGAVDATANTTTAEGSAAEHGEADVGGTIDTFGPSQDSDVYHGACDASVLLGSQRIDAYATSLGTDGSVLPHASMRPTGERPIELQPDSLQEQSCSGDSQCVQEQVADVPGTDNDMTESCVTLENFPGVPSCNDFDDMMNAEQESLAFTATSLRTATSDSTNAMGTSSVPNAKRSPKHKRGSSVGRLDPAYEKAAIEIARITEAEKQNWTTTRDAILLSQNQASSNEKPALRLETNLGPSHTKINALTLAELPAGSAAGRPSERSNEVSSIISVAGSMRGPHPSVGTFKTRNIAVVGESYVGKSALIGHFQSGVMPTQLSITIMPGPTKVKNDDHNVHMDFRDTCGLMGFERFRLLAYRDAHVILLCFALDEPDSLSNIEHFWADELTKSCPGRPVILVGTKSDLLDNEHTKERLAKNGQHLVDQAEIDAACKSVGAIQYRRCSASTGAGVAEVFETAVSMVLQPTLRHQRNKRSKVWNLKRIGKIENLPE